MISRKEEVVTYVKNDFSFVARAKPRLKSVKGSTAQEVTRMIREGYKLKHFLLWKGRLSMGQELEGVSGSRESLMFCL